MSCKSLRRGVAAALMIAAGLLATAAPLAAAAPQGRGDRTPRPAPVRPDPTPVRPAPSRPDPTPVRPAPSRPDPTPVRPAPSRPDPTPVRPAPSRPDPTPVRPAPTRSDATPSRADRSPRTGVDRADARRGVTPTRPRVDSGAEAGSPYRRVVPLGSGADDARRPATPDRVDRPSRLRLDPGSGGARVDASGRVRTDSSGSTTPRTVRPEAERREDATRLLRPGSQLSRYKPGEEGAEAGTRSARSVYGRSGVAAPRRDDARPDRAGTRAAPAEARPSRRRHVAAGPAPTAVATRSESRIARPVPPRTFVTATSSSSTSAGPRRASHLSVSYFSGASSWGFNLYSGPAPLYHGGTWASCYGYGGGPWYDASYLHGPGYAGYWSEYYWGRGAPVFSRHARFHFGYTYYRPCGLVTPYPVYRRCLYEPYYVVAYSRVVPAYRVYWYTHAPVWRRYVTQVRTYDTWVEVVDPYVDEEVVVGAWEVESEGYDWSADVAPAAAAPAAAPRVGAGGLELPYVASFPEGLSYDECIAYGEEALFDADYLGAAEAFRRAALLRPDQDYPRFRLADALFGAGRYAEAAPMIEIGLDLNPSWLHRRFRMVDSFAGEDEFSARVHDLESHLLVEDGDDDARFVLACVYFRSGNPFGARSLVTRLRDDGAPIRHLDALARAAEDRLMEGRAR